MYDHLQNYFISLDLDFTEVLIPLMTVENEAKFYAIKKMHKLTYHDRI